MATFYSVEETKLNSLPAGNYLLDPRDLVGRVRLAYFSYTVPASSGPGSTDTLVLCRVPNLARIIAGTLVVSALGTSCAASIGYAGATTRYGSALAVAAAGATAFAATAAQNYGDELTAQQDMLLTFSGAAPAAAGTIQGHFLYVVD